MSLEDNINKEHLKIILDEYDTDSYSLSVNSLERAIMKIGYPDKYSTFLLLSLLSESSFTNIFMKKEIERLKKEPSFANILYTSIGEYYHKNAPRLSDEDKPNKLYARHLTPVIDDQDIFVAGEYMKKFYQNGMDVDHFIYAMNQYFKHREDNYKSEFIRAMNVAESWLVKNKTISTMFVDYAMLRLDGKGDLDYVIKDEYGGCAMNGDLREKLINSMKDKGLKIEYESIPTETFSEEPSNVIFLDEYKDKEKTSEDQPDKKPKKNPKPKKDEAKIERRKKIINLESYLKTVIFEQDHAIDEVARVLANKETGIANPDKAYGLLFTGPSGVGKTEVARQLNSYFYPSQELLKIDCSEYSQEHEISKLIGSPPGYVGSDQAGLIADYIRKYQSGCVVVFDEIEKAHPKVRNFLLSLLDSKTMLDNHKKEYDVFNTTVIMTSNVGNSGIDATKKGIGFDSANNHQSKGRVRLQYIKKEFPQEFLGRTHLVEFNGLSYQGVTKIFYKKLESQQKNVYAQNKLYLQVTDSARDRLLNICDWSEAGGRNVERNLEKILTPFSWEILKGEKMKPEEALILDYLDNEFRYGVRSKDGKNTLYFLKKPA